MTFKEAGKTATDDTFMELGVSCESHEIPSLTFSEKKINKIKKKIKTVPCCNRDWHPKGEERIIDSIMGLSPRQGNFRLVFRLFSLMRGLPRFSLKKKAGMKQKIKRPFSL